MKQVLLFFTLLSFDQISYSAEVLKYEPTIVTVQGALSIQNFPGPPNYESVAHGDKLEREWILTLKKPIRVVAPPGDELFFTQNNVREIQLVCLKGCDDSYSFSPGKTVSLIGTLFSAHTAHHHKGVLMIVKKAK